MVSLVMKGAIFIVTSPPEVRRRRVGERRMEESWGMSLLSSDFISLSSALGDAVAAAGAESSQEPAPMVTFSAAVTVKRCVSRCRWGVEGRLSMTW